MRVLRWAVFGLVFLQVFSAFAMTGKEVVEKSNALAKPGSVTSEVSMEIEKAGRVTEKLFALTSMEGDDGEERALIAFKKPSRIKLLTHTHAEGGDDQWLQMSSGRVKRISQSSKRKAFVNSHFTYEDLSSRKMDDYDYTMMGEAKVDGEPCHVVESRRVRGKRVYEKTLLYISAKDWFVRRIDFFQKGRHVKSLYNRKIEVVKGYITPHELVMKRVEGGQTRMILKDVAFDTPMRLADFRKETLR